MVSRLAPLDPPYEPEVARTLERMMPPGMPPLLLFRTVARNPALLDKMRSTGAYLLNFGTLDPADRELVILRTCARCGCEYEWGVHVAVFADQVGLAPEAVEATAQGGSDDPALDRRQRLLVRLSDELHDTATVSDHLWGELAATWSDEQLVELVTLAGQYHVVSYCANALGVPLEKAAPRFPS